MPVKGFPGGSDSKDSALQYGRPGFNPWVGKIPGGGHDSWRIPIDRGDWHGTVHWVAESDTCL